MRLVFDKILTLENDFPLEGYSALDSYNTNLPYDFNVPMNSTTFAFTDFAKSYGNSAEPNATAAITLPDISIIEFLDVTRTATLELLVEAYISLGLIQEDISKTIVEYVSELKQVHFNRNNLQTPELLGFEFTYEQMLLQGFTKLPHEQAIFHKIDAPNNVKWVSADGLYEFVFEQTSTGFRLLDASIASDIKNLGTYNFAPPTDGTLHILLDVIPWIFWGNASDDTTSITQRKNLFLLDGAQETAEATVTSVFNSFKSFLENALQFALDIFDLFPNLFTEPPGDETDNTLFADENGSRLLGLGGNDTLFAGVAPDILDGGSGVDLVSYASSLTGISLSLQRGQGFDGDAQGDTFANIENVVGSSHSDVIIGSNVANEIWGANGFDVIYGLSGNDILRGANGNDTLIGGIGADIMFGGAGNDIIYADGDDIELNGGDGNDLLILDVSSLAHTVTINFDDPNLTVGMVISNFETYRFVRSDSSVHVLTEEAETVDTTTQNDFVSIRFSSGYWEGFTLSGGAGDDTLALDFSTIPTFRYNNRSYDSVGVTTLLSNGVVTGYQATFRDTVTSTFRHSNVGISEFENLHITGNQQNDILTTGSGDDVLHGMAGNDTLNAGAGADQIYGGDGNDQILGGDGDDTELHGGAGTDYLVLDRSLLGAAVNWDLSSAGVLTSGSQNISGFERYDLKFGTGDDIVTFAMTQSATDTFDMGAGNDSLSIDILRGLFSGLTLSGGAGDDTLALDFSTIPTFRYNNRSYDSVGVTTLLSNGVVTGYQATFRDTVTSTFRHSNVGISEFENLHITGNQQNDILTTGSGDDVLHGMAGNDTLNAGAGADQIYGGDGNDQILGGDGDDTELHGGAGTDYLVLDRSLLGAAVNWDLSSAGVLTSGSQNISGFERYDLKFGTGDDIVTFAMTQSATDTFDMGAGNDSLSIDILRGLFSGLTLSGGAGDDTLALDFSTIPTFRYNNRSYDSVGVTTLLSNGVVTGYQATFRDTVTSTFRHSNVGISEFENLHITGNQQNDILTTGSGDDVLHGMAGNDTLNAGAGA